MQRCIESKILTKSAVLVFLSLHVTATTIELNYPVTLSPHKQEEEEAQMLTNFQEKMLHMESVIAGEDEKA